MNKSLAALLEKSKSSRWMVAQVDWDDRRKKYLASVDNLYQQIETILADPLEQKMVALQRRSKQLTDSKWEFVQTLQPQLNTVPFDDSTFPEVLQLVMRD